jgi:hypothetical protein
VLRLVACVVALLGYAPASGQARTGRPARLASQAEAAARAARSLLKQDEQLPEARSVPRPPATVRDALDHPPPHEIFAHDADRVTFLVSRARPGELLSYFLAHAPSGSRVRQGGSGGSDRRRSYWWEELEVPGGGKSQPRRLVLGIAIDGHQFATRIEARVAWHLPHPPGFAVPSTAEHAQVSVVRIATSSSGDQRHEIRQRFVIARPSAVATIARTVNDLPPFEPTSPFPSCSVFTAVTLLELRFSEADGSATLATVTVNPDACGFGPVHLLLADGQQAEFNENARIVSVVEHQVGHHLNL